MKVDGGAMPQSGYGMVVSVGFRDGWDLRFVILHHTDFLFTKLFF